jgi:hypothetical protein
MEHTQPASLLSLAPEPNINTKYQRACSDVKKHGATIQADINCNYLDSTWPSVFDDKGDSGNEFPLVIPSLITPYSIYILKMD